MKRIFETFKEKEIYITRESMSTVQMIKIDRKNLDLFLRDYINYHKPSVYILIKNNPNKNVVYVGETENIGERLKQHNKEKEFWQSVLIFQTVDNSFNKAHYKYLEYEIFMKLKHNENNVVINKNIPTKSNVSIQDEIKTEIFLNNVEELLKIHRYDLLNSLKCMIYNKELDVKYLDNGLSIAKMKVDNYEYTLLKGALLLLTEESDNETRQSLIRKGIIKIIDKDINVGLLTMDFTCDSDTLLAILVTGNPEVDYTIWR